MKEIILFIVLGIFAFIADKRIPYAKNYGGKKSYNYGLTISVILIFIMVMMCKYLAIPNVN